MKYNIILGIVIIAMSVQLSSCKNDKTIEKKEEIINKASDTIFDSKNPYYLFITKNHPEAFKGNELIYFKEEDIDLDGKKEAIVALGELSKEDEMETSVNQIFLLRNVSGKIKKLYDFQRCGYSVNAVKLVSLHGKKQKYIYLSLTNYVNLTGFDLLELAQNKVKSICYSASPSGRGHDDLVDNDNNGKFDGYVQFRDNTDALYYDVEVDYVFKGNVFTRSETHVEMPKYLETIEELILQYISLRSLDFGDSSEVSQRLKEICVDKDAPALKWDKDAWSDGYIKSYLALDGQIEFDTEVNDNNATVFVNCSSCMTEQLRLELTKNDKKWQITAVDVLELHE